MKLKKVAHPSSLSLISFFYLCIKLLVKLFYQRIFSKLLNFTWKVAHKALKKTASLVKLSCAKRGLNSLLHGGGQFKKRRMLPRFCSQD